MDHGQTLETDQPIEIGQEPVDCDRVGDVVVGAPEVGCVEADGEAPICPPPSGCRVENRATVGNSSDEVRLDRHGLGETDEHCPEL